MKLLEADTAIGFVHKKPALPMAPHLLLSTLLEFVDDTKQEQESECQGWGAEDLVFPASEWETVFNLLSNYDTITDAKESGHLHIDIEETLEGDDVNAVTLKGGYLNITQRIVFYDLTAAQKAA